jgi:hypothetical protein
MRWGFSLSKGMTMKRALFGLLLCWATNLYTQPLQVIWDRSGVGDHSHFGTGIVALGDQNQDGFDNWAVLSAGRAAPGDDNESRFDLFRGGNPPSTVPYMTFRGRLSPRRDFLEANVIGDVNGDGFKDWWTWNLVPGDTVVQVDIYFGGPSADTIPDVLFHFPATGWDWMDPVGDINGDGYDDFYFYNAGGVGLPLDRTFFFFGGNPLDTIPDMVIHGNPRGSQSSLPRAFGDINGDGYGDFLTTNHNSTQTTYIFLGGNPPDTLPDYEWYNFQVGDCTLQPDLNADGRTDLCIAQFESIDVHFGGNAMSRTPNFTLSFPQCDGGPWELGSAGDFNHDGFEDLVAVDPSCNQSHGGLKLYLGHPWLYYAPVIEIYGRRAPLNLVGIRHATGLGDVNGDGIEDLAIGATNEEAEGQQGRVVILSGDTTLRADSKEQRVLLPTDLRVTVFPNPFNSETTIRFDVPVFAPELDLNLYNLLGQAVQHITLRVMPGIAQYHLDAGALATGVYLLRVQVGSLSNTQKLMVLR